MTDGQDIAIRRMNAADAPAVKAFETETGLSPWPEADYAAEPDRDDSVALVALRAGKTVGFIVARLITIRNHPGYSPDSITNLEIYNLAVSSFLRRERIGQTLVRAAIETARAIGPLDFVELEVRLQNAGAQRFYEHLGFKRTGVRPAFYSNPTDDAVQMALGLTNA